MGRIPTKLQVSAGGVVFRRSENQIQVALISVGQKKRWQLPKGLVNPDELNENAAIREVREETGLEAELVALIDKIEYWYASKEQGQPVRFHKFVYFYLLRYQSGSTENHDHEVNEACWVAIDQAYKLLTFKTEQKVVKQAKEMVLSLPQQI
ncbi:MAG: NUDIX hydrolase [Anaerolineae bacterium]|nr:NUDIX hydrolase [Anaerolineae bacterium]